ncbi:receptor-like protein EIX2 [Cocos nucifera]|uniref:Receptor-like protein EIX2 n=1 Tax=Cocos nucifera TaxID=13894 RepID=A0A8K0N8L0_COCNU|nr:receptor-like protein EIX2 [Cocos nucifera]
MLIVLLLLYLYLIGGDGSIVEGSCIEKERKALLAIKADIYDPDRWLSSWTGQDCCGWKGVGCNGITGHVVKLDLKYPYDFMSQIFDEMWQKYFYYYFENMKYPGPSKVNPSLLDLMHLKYLDLSLNNFSGAPIPKFIGSLVHLEYLNLSYAEFSGSIPPELGNLSNLRFLDMSQKDNYFDDYGWTSLRADSLRWLSNIPSLHSLDLSGVNLSKAADWLHEINLLPSLSDLHLSDAGLPLASASISHVNLTSLTMLDLSGSYHVNATIPRWLFNISSLVHMNLQGCYLSDTLLFAMGNLHNLHGLDLSDNQITREIFPNLANLSHLEHLHMASNKISGNIPESIGNLRNLVELDLSYNQNISGEIPEFIGNLSHLQVLDLSENEIKGEIPEFIENLIQLRVLDLSFNKIKGEIPEFIENLMHLQVLELSGNEISGEIPDLFDKLYDLCYLGLESNNITGKIPRSIGNLCKLRVLNIRNNNITGELADTIESWSTCIKNRLDGRSYVQGLIALLVGYNKLSGTIPQTLSQLSALQELDLASNSFTGHLTEAHFANLTRLYYLDLSYNSFQVSLNQHWVPPFNATFIAMCSCHLGPKFPTWLQTQTNLEELLLCENNISDGFPTWFWDLKNIYRLNVSHNSMTGWLPTSLGGQHYESFDVSSNNFHGPIPELDPLYLDTMILSNNSFSGPIPLSFAKAMNLRFFILSHNHINGSIPQFLCNLSSLQVLDISNNNLSGGVRLFFSIMDSLEVLDLSNNGLFGELHHCRYKAQQGMIDSQEDSKLEHSSHLMACPVYLQSLHLRNNRLSGKLPSLLKNCKQLVILDLSENRFSGELPIWIGERLRSLRVLSFRTNFFNGSIPVQLSHLTFLQVLDLACNKFSGALPPSFGNFSAMMRIQNAEKTMLSDFNAYYTEGLLITTKGIEIEYTSVLALVMGIDLSQNNFSGVIPTELVNLYGLSFLNLSNNHFTGKIPENIGALRQLESLDLSVNNLSGMIPSTISSLYSLSHLNLSNNNLSGRIPWGNQLQTFCDPSIYGGNPNLHVWPLPGCVNIAPSKSPFQTRAQEEEPRNGDESEMIWLYASSSMGFVVGLLGFIYVFMIKQAIRIAYFHLIDMTYDYIHVQLAMRFAKLKSVLPILMNNGQG